MAVAQVTNIVRVTWKYALSPNEISEHSVCYRAGAVPSDPAVLHAVLHDMSDAALASQAAHVPQSHWGPAVVASGTRVALENTSGHTIDEAISAATGDLAWAGSSSSKQMPYEDSICISVYGYEPGTFDPLGRYKRGRFYLPPPASDMLAPENNGLIRSDYLEDIGNAWLTVLRELQEHTYSGFPTFSPVLGINSRTRIDFFNASWLRWDQKWDRQSRRQNKLIAPTQDFPYPGS